MLLWNAFRSDKRSAAGFLPRDAMHSTVLVIVNLHVRPSVCLSHLWTTVRPTIMIRPPGSWTISSGRAYVLPVMYLFLSFSFRHAFSELPWPIALKLCHMLGIWLYFIIPLQKFGGRSPQKNWGQKQANFRSILDNFRFWSRISPERLKMSKIGRRYKLWQYLLRSTNKVPRTLVH